jgi:ribosome production factor 2
LLLKKPDGIPFSKANLNLHPFEDATALEFWSQKNDAAFIVMGSHSKKRPNNLTLARMFDHQVLDMLEVGVDMVQTIADVKVRS